MRRSKFVLFALLAVSMFGFASTSQAQTFDVTITNLTGGQIISPPVVYTYRGDFRPFHVGQRASSDLAALAEDASSGGLIAELTSSREVGAVEIADGVLFPGQSKTVRVRGNGFQRVAALGMLVTTNDAFFFGSTSVLGNSASVYALAYDAGSERNTQLCDDIPGPPCGNGGVRVTDGAEGYVFVHSGITADGDLTPSAHDWRNPVARIRVTRFGANDPDFGGVAEGTATNLLNGEASVSSASSFSATPSTRSSGRSNTRASSGDSVSSIRQRGNN